MEGTAERTVPVILWLSLVKHQPYEGASRMRDDSPKERIEAEACRRLLVFKSPSTSLNRGNFAVSS